MIIYNFQCTFMTVYRLDIFPLVSQWCQLAHFLVSGVKGLIQFCTCRDMRIHHQEVQFFLALFLMDCTQQHTARIDSHHLTRGKVCDGDTCLSDKFLRLIECMDSAEDRAVCSGAVIQRKLQ